MFRWSQFPTAAGIFLLLGAVVWRIEAPAKVVNPSQPQTAQTQPVKTPPVRSVTGIPETVSLNRLAPTSDRDAATLPQCVDRFGIKRRYRPGIVLAKFIGAARPQALVVERGREESYQRSLSARPDVAYAELDFVLTRQFAPNDPGLPIQWHHRIIQSTNAWSLSLGNSSVILAIVDNPFQMNHPDLASNAIPGWSMVQNRPIDSDPVGYYHSTICAGMAAAVLNNGVGVSGVVNCQLMPIDVGNAPTASDMHRAIVWAADHGVRVVNVSWDGAFSGVINDAGAYLKQKTRGMLFMSGVNGSGRLDYPNQPDIYAVSMTDVNDGVRSASGPHIDFSAPGYDIYSTTTNSTYEVDSGSSYSTPLMAGIAAWVMSVNPALGPDEIEQILKNACVDAGDPGWDEKYGWGRIDFGSVARQLFAASAESRIEARPVPFFTVAARYIPGAEYTLYRTENPGVAAWNIISPGVSTNGNELLFTDRDVALPHAFYRLEMLLPR